MADISRREFLGTGAWGAGGLAAAVAAPSRSAAPVAAQAPKRRPQRVAVVGADHYHATATPNYLRILKGQKVELVGVHAPEAAIASKWAAEYGSTPYTDYRVMIEKTLRLPKDARKWTLVEASLRKLTELASVRDFEQLALEAHSLKGVSANYGIWRLHNLCARLQPAWLAHWLLGKDPPADSVPEEHVLIPEPVPIKISYLDTRSQMQLAALR